MSQIILVAHAPCATALQNAAGGVLGKIPDLAAIDLPFGATETEMATILDQQLPALSEQCLILTDLLGSTPQRLCRERAAAAGARVLCGVNLNMLLRAINYRDEPVDTLWEKARSGGTRGICAGDQDG